MTGKSSGGTVPLCPDGGSDACVAGSLVAFEGLVGGDHACLIRDRTLHMMPDGYHTVTAAPGYRVCYLAVYAGRDKRHRPSPHPLHVNYQTALTT